ncbi:hypothetical protein VUR80DRAFT_2078 [Thermomyces stellatus]
MPARVMRSHSLRDDDGGGAAQSTRENNSHMSQPDVGMTTRGVGATLCDQETDDTAAVNGKNKDYSPCSCPSAPLSPPCSFSSTSGLTNSPFMSHSLAGQAMTPLSMGDSEYSANREPAVRKLGRPPTPFNALAGSLTLDDESGSSAPQNALDETNKSHEPACNRPPPLSGAQPPDPLNTSAEPRHPRYDNLPAESLGLVQKPCHEDTDDARTQPLDEVGNVGNFDGTDRRLSCADSCAGKCDDGLDASHRPAVATQTEHFAVTSGSMLAGSYHGKQLQLGERRRCRPTEPAAAPLAPRSDCSDTTSPPCGGDPGIPPTSPPGPLNPSDPGAKTHYHACAPEHDVPRATNPGADGPNAARDGKIVNSKRPSRNSSLTAAVSRDPPFSSLASASPPSHLSSFISPPPPLAPIPASIEQSSQGKEESFQPLVRRASDNSSLRIQHPIPDAKPETGALLGNIAHLEATAEHLSSTTASIEDAIRDLHAKLKRSDSQRSAAARARARIQFSEHEADGGALTSRLCRSALIKPPPSLVRRRTHSGRTTTTIQPARYRPRSGSLNDVMQSAADMDPYMSRTGPGKGSVRSVRTGKQSLAEISESEPVGLTNAAFDEADRSNMTDGDDDTIRPHTGHDKIPKRESFIPSTHAFHAMPDPGRAPNSEDFFSDPETRAPHFLPVEEQRPTTSASNASSTHMNSVFRDFDGVHCDPDVNILPHSPQGLPTLDERLPAPPHASGPESPPKPRATSYFDNETGKEMLYYPARVPAMLSLPPKLSKKPKAASRNQRQSYVLSTMPEIARRSRASWLPEPLADNPETPFLHPVSLSTDDSFTAMTKQSTRPEDHAGQQTTPDGATTLDPNPAAPEIHVTATPTDPENGDEVKPAIPRPRKDDAGDVNARKSRLSKYGSNLPPQLRASVFFEPPSNTTKLEVKDGSATATLDHLLDASTTAPVSAFTDHMIAGKLGSEVYGTEKRRSASPTSQQAQQQPKESDAKKRGSLFHRVKRSEDFERNARSESGTSDASDDEALPPGAVGYATLGPDGDDVGEDDRPDGEKVSDSKAENNEEYYGPPTTLLAELQIRKQQQKNRTRPISQAFPNGMHSTLLELDAVAEEQRKSRKGRKVNLAWEEPDPTAAGEGSDDEDVPLGVLFAGKATGMNDVAELNRPMGLMERREMEENEPLSQRRARLQGHDPGRKRQTLIPNPATRMSANRLSQMPTLGSLPVHQRASSPGSAEQDEIEDETLGERKRRLKKKEEENLPQARPVSADFSSELLSQFGGLEDKKKEEKEDTNVAGDSEAEEETLGQRRRRLQAEREGQGPRPAEHQASASSSAPAKRLSMANILTAHPKRDTTLQDEERRKAQEASRFRRSQEEKLAALRSQMPTSLEKPSAGAATGGFGNGRFNDGTGGMGRRVSRGLGVPGTNPDRSSVVLGDGMIQQAGVSSMMGPSAGQYGGYNGPQLYNYAAGQYNGMAPAAGWYPQAQAPLMPGMQPQLMPMQMGTTMPSQGQSDSIERWRHSVMP